MAYSRTEQWPLWLLVAITHLELTVYMCAFSLFVVKSPKKFKSPKIQHEHISNKLRTHVKPV